ncbi:MAG: response regulator receiver protein [Bryobacterales bacterium]|nr:response regulator receiver protein [Bryobacterales bacterium]
MRMQILLVEDNPGDVLLVRMALDHHQVSHHLTLARDGAEAIEIIQTMGGDNGPPCPDLMLMDLHLDKIEGTEVIAAFRQHPSCVETPVVVLTSSAEPGELGSLARFGVKLYFQKPYDFDHFMELGKVVISAVARSEREAITF